MTNKQSAFTLSVMVASLLFSGGCSKKLAGSELLDIGVTNSGIILQTTTQSCVDKSSTTQPPPRSLAAPSMYFSGMSFSWKSDTLDLFIGEIKITVTSNKLTGGKFEAQLDSTEIEALTGAKNATLKREVVTGQPHVYSSTSTQKDKSGALAALAPCGLAVGGITLADPSNTGQFTAPVTIELIGTAQNDDGSVQQTVRQTVNATATYY